LGGTNGVSDTGPGGMQSRLAARRAARQAEADTDWTQELPRGGGGPGRPDLPGPAHAAPPGRPERRRWWRRGPLWARVVAGLALVALAVLLAPAPLVDPFVDRTASRYQGECTTFTGLDVGSGSWPAVLRAATGHLRGVTGHADEIRFDNDFTIHDVDFSADQVDVPPLRLGTTDADAEVRGGESSASVDLADIERILAGWNVTADLHGEGASLVADVQVPFVGVVPTTVDMVPVDGDLELRFAALDVIQLPSMVIAFPEPVRLRGVDVRGESMRVSTTVDGSMGSGEWGCDTSASQGTP
jgi:hypothetical protein